MPLRRCDFQRASVPDRTGDGIGTDSAQTVGYLLRISERTKCGLRAGGWKCREKVFQIEAQNDVLVPVWAGKGHNRPSFDESMNGVVGRDAIENCGQDSALKFLEISFRTFNQPNAAGMFPQDAIAIMLEFGVMGFVAKSLQIGEPFEFRRGEREPVGEIPNCFDDWKIPLL